jgi:hypothetical protein
MGLKLQKNGVQCKIFKLLFAMNRYIIFFFFSEFAYRECFIFSAIHLFAFTKASIHGLISSV